MIFPPLPYPGFTWSFSQHAVALDKTVLKNLLECAYPFEGQTTGYQAKITELIIASDILTHNRRDGKADAWRDYQQILPELGLIYSTKIYPSLKLTPLGHLYVSGELSHESIIGMQSLRYQYPNGQKYTISPKVKQSLRHYGLRIPDNLIQLQLEAGVLIKPGCLVLRVLLELLNSGHKPELSASECRVFLMPCKTNAQWKAAYKNILKNRIEKNDVSKIFINSNRNIQDWFKFLRESNLFISDGKSFVGLSNMGIEIHELLLEIHDKETSEDEFWVPQDKEVNTRVAWFHKFGTPNSSHDFEFSYETEFDIEEVEEIFSVTNAINLKEFNAEDLFTLVSPNISTDIKSLAEKVQRGVIKRHAKSLLHDKIVDRYATKYRDLGAEVFMDRDSVDLFVKWSDSESTLFEVKTVTTKSISQRIRMGVGQVKEYRYRLESEQNIKPDQALIIDRILPDNQWRQRFLTEFMDIGLICWENEVEKTFPPISTGNSFYWR